MQRSWLFTLTDITKTYNLWTDLIKPLITDLTFSNYPFTPSTVQELEIQNQSAGSTVTRNGFSLTSGSWDVNRASVNSIDLKTVNITTDTNPTVIYVSILAN